MDPFTVAAIGTAGTELLTTGSNIYMNERANAANKEIAREQMAFQERMSNTAHQREVEDLKAAGLNPLLSAGGSGASTPAGASTRINASQIAKNPLNLLELQQMRQNIKKTQAETLVANNTADNLTAQNLNLTAQNSLIAAQVYKTYIDAGATRAQAAANVAKLFGNETTSLRLPFGLASTTTTKPTVKPDDIEKILQLLPDLNGQNPYK